MRPLSSRELLQVWEWGETQHPIDRALTLLAIACPETSPEKLAQLSVGQRDTLLLTLREWTFGSQLNSLATCPSCGEYLELNFTVADIQVSPDVNPTPEHSLSLGDYEVKFRLPNSSDLAAIASYQDTLAARHTLLETCLLAASYQGKSFSIQQLPSPVIEAVVEKMAQADPQADVQLALSCPGCKHQWQATFDIVSYFWSEINAWAKRILLEVHTLASAYGWGEADILAMSPRRRQLYLEMVSQ
jgi:hypothetical protein